MIGNLRAPRLEPAPVSSPSTCEHRTVSKDGLIVCKKISHGDNRVTPNECRVCPFKAVNCTHLRFSLQQSSPSPLIVRFNGREEVWNDEPPQLRFEQAACAAKVTPIDQPQACASCSLRQPVQPTTEKAARLVSRPSAQPAASTQAKVVPFRPRKAAAG